MGGIFISYRRGQTSAYAGRLYDRLTHEFGDERVFMDINAIDPGTDFVERIEQAVGEADVLLLIIGSEWVGATASGGGRRLDDPDDFVRREVIGALKRETLLVPVLVQAASMPSGDELPTPMNALGRRNAIELTDSGWSRDVDRLVATLHSYLPGSSDLRHVRTQRRRTALSVVVGLVAIAVATVVPFSGSDGAGLRTVGEPAPVAGFALHATAVGGNVWVSSDRLDQLQIVDRSTRKVSDSPTYGRDLGASAAGGGMLLVGAYGRSDDDGRGAVLRINPRTGQPVGPAIQTVEPLDIATEGSSLWVVSESGRVQRLNLRTGKLTREADVGTGLDVVLLNGDAWVLTDRAELLVFDAITGRRKGDAIAVGAQPLSVAATADALWVVTGQGRLVRVSPEGGAQRSLVVGGEGNRVVAANADGVWIVDALGEVVLVDPRRTAIRGRLNLGGDLQGVTLDAGGAWVIRARSTQASSIVRVVRS